MLSEFRLASIYRYGRTDIEDIYFTSPYKIMHPFYDGEKTEVILMSSSAGLLSGDHFDCDITLGKDTCLTFLTQSYEKILDTMDDKASRNINLKVGENAFLKYMPQPAIPFTNSRFESKCEAHLEKGAGIFLSEVFSCGRVGMNEKYGFRSFNSKTKVYIENELVFADNTYIVPKEIDYTGLGMWGEYTHSGMAYIYVPDLDKLADIKMKIKNLIDEQINDQVRKSDEMENILAGVSECKKGLIVRSLGFSGDDLFRFNESIGVTL